jgi:hypothetical protein
VFAAFDDYLIMWDVRTGADRGQLRLPSFREEASRLGLEFDDANEPWWIFYSPPIQSLLLYQDRLVVFSNQYSDVLSQLLDYNPILQFYLNTRVLVYDTSAVATGGKLTLLFQQNINGQFKKAQRIGSVVHTVTTSRMKYQKLFDEPLDRLNFGDITKEEYIAQVRRLAETVLIPTYVRGLTEELTVNGKLPNIARMSLMQTKWNMSQFNPLLYKYGLANFYVQLSSLDLTLPMTTGPSTANVSMNMNMTGIIVPFTHANVYSAVDTLLLATHGYDFESDTLDYRSVTYLLAYDLIGASANLRALGRVQGSLLNEYSVDVMDDIVRIGTTAKDQQWCCDPWNINSTSASSTGQNMSRTMSADANFDTTTNTSEALKTTNYISMLRIPALNQLSSSSPGVMDIVGQLKLGKKAEEFASIRFFDSIAYAVTMTQVYLNPDYYILSLSDSANPQILGRMNTSVDAFSGSLYPMNGNNTLILAIDRKVESYTFVGLQINVLDASNPAQPIVIQQYVITDKDFSSIETSASWDFYSLRYDPQTQRLILPVSMTGSKNSAPDYNGFHVFIVNEHEITPTCRIEIAPDINRDDCYYCAGFRYRSMIFRGSIMALVDHFVTSTDLKSCTSEWNLTVSPPLSADQSCCKAFFFPLGHY